MSAAPVLSVRDLVIAAKTSGGADRILVSGVSFDLYPGRCAALVGESGAGKSLSAKAVVSLLPAGTRAASGSILFEGRSLLGLSEKELCALRGKDIGVIFQDPLAALNPLHHAGDQVEEAFLAHASQSRITQEEARAKTLELFTALKIGEPEKAMRAYPHELSGGQRQRVVIAIALANRPKLLIADEPTTALDASVQKSVIDLLLKLAREHNIALLLISHDLPMVSRVADSLFVMRSGRIIERLSAHGAPKEPYTKLLLNAGPHRWADEDRPQKFMQKLKEGSLPKVLEARNLSVSYKRKPRGFFKAAEALYALRPIDLHLYKGETLGVVGESGSGKTTLALALLRLISSKGGIYFEGEVLSGLPEKKIREIRRKIQPVFQDPFSSLNPRMSILDIVSEGPAAARLAPPEVIREKALQTLSDVHLPLNYASRYPHELSGGERQRAAIARALALDPEVLILDEPTTSLDRALQFEIISLFKELQAKRGLTCLFITHDLALVREFAERVIVLKNGRLVEEGMTREAFTHPKSAYLKSLIELSFNAAPHN